MKKTSGTYWIKIIIIWCIGIFPLINGCTVIGLIAGHADDKEKSSVDRSWSTNQVDSIDIGKKIEVHSNSGTILNGIYMGNETSIYDDNVKLLLLKVDSNVAKIKHSTISEIRVYAQKKNSTLLLGLLGAAIDITVSIISVNNYLRNLF